MSYQDIAHHYEDGPECPPPSRVLRCTEHTARKRHVCDCCQAYIQPGERYLLLAELDPEEGFQLHKSHAASGRCAELHPQVEAFLAQQAEDYSF